MDMGSGSGGAMPEVLDVLCEEHDLCDIKLSMTDLYPDARNVKKFNNSLNPNIDYLPNPVDATNITAAPVGLKTMINSFHHMRPKAAREILASAEKNKQPILIYEMGENIIPLVLWWLLLPLSLIILIIMVLFMTPFVKPMSWQQIVFTYILPIIPICYAWDGQASLPRMYTMDDMDVLLEGLGSENYIWQKGHALKKNNKKSGTYLMGLPKEFNEKEITDK